MLKSRAALPNVPLDGVGAVFVTQEPPPGVRVARKAREANWSLQDVAVNPDYEIAKQQILDTPFDVLPRPPVFALSAGEIVHSSLIQTWEGTVVRVDGESHTMEVRLNAKIGQVPEHTGEIDLQWVSEQDKDLVQPGAIFYLTLSRRVKRGGIENNQELRFRRLPSWTKRQVAQVERDACMLLSKMKAKPIAE
ncbi:MAG: hypothetical protein ACYDEV_07600 [Acidiferrobacter sp.]